VSAAAYVLEMIFVVCHGCMVCITMKNVDECFIINQQIAKAKPPKRNLLQENVAYAT
jgi:hypothetical protein